MEKLHHVNILREFSAPDFTCQTVLKEGGSLIVRMPNWLGDAVMALPALYQLKKMLSGQAELGVICPAGLRPLFYSLPWVDRIFPLGSTHRKWTPEERQAVRDFAPSAGVLFNNSLRDTIMLRMCGVKNLCGAAARGRSILMKRSFRFPGRVSRELNCLHHANKYLAIARAAGAEPWNGQTIPLEIAVPFMQTREEIRALCDHPRMLILAAGAAYGAAKRWPGNSFRETARRWIAAGGIAVCVGGPSETLIGDEICSGLPQSHCFNMMGKTDMYELMHLLRHAAHTVANDSGVMHLAAIMNSPGTAIFGSTDYTATGPVSEIWNIFYQKRDCSPCFCRICPNGQAGCMRDISPDDVWEKIRPN